MPKRVSWCCCGSGLNGILCYCAIQACHQNAINCVTTTHHHECLSTDTSQLLSGPFRNTRGVPLLSHRGTRIGSPLSQQRAALRHRLRAAARRVSHRWRTSALMHSASKTHKYCSYVTPTLVRDYRVSRSGDLGYRQLAEPVRGRRLLPSRSSGLSHR